MKKVSLLFAILMAILMNANAQIVFQENFDAVPDDSLPTGWARFNVDGHTPYSSVSWVNKAWVCYAKPTGWQITSKCAWSTSYYSPAATADDWMFTPAINIPATNPGLQFLTVSQDPSYPDGYELRVMTTAPTSGNLTTSTVVYSTVASETTPTTKIINLGAYAGQSVYIGWRNNTFDGFCLAVDDVVVKTLPGKDVTLVSLNMPLYVAAGNTNITGTIHNIAFDTVHSYDVVYTVDGGSPSPTYHVTGQNIITDHTANFTHNVPANLTAGDRTIQVTISNINGSADENPADNVLSTTIHVASQVVPTMPLFEGFSASTCPPCATYNGTIFNSWAAAHDADMNFIKYQVNWPGAGDPYYIAQTGDRVAYYGVTGVPAQFANGTEIVRSLASLNAALAYYQAVNAVFAINLTPTYTGNAISIPVTINPYVTATGLKVQVVIVERLTTGNVGTNGETSWHHVMMQMLPGSAGTTVNFTDGTPYTHTFTYTHSISTDSIEEINDLIAVVFIQDNGTKQVLQSKAMSITLAGIDELSSANIKIYPNPASDNVNIINAKNSNMMLYDVYGKLIMSGNIIDNDYSLNISDLATGNYLIKLVNGDKMISKKISVIK